MGIVNEITMVISRHSNVRLNKISFEAQGGTFNGKITIGVNSNTALQKLIDEIKSMKGLNKVFRI
jgi:GTP pyrophosphokinase